MSDHIEMGLSVALTAARKARALIEDNADGENPSDAVVLGRVYAHLLDVTASLAGVHAVLKQRAEMQAVLESADTERPSGLRLVR